MKYSIATVAVALIAAAAAPNASASIVEHATEQRELWGKDWYKWTPNEPEECYDFDKCFDCLDECKDKAEYAEEKCDKGWKPDWYGCDETSCTSQAKCIFDKCKMKCDGCSGKKACGKDDDDSSSSSSSSSSGDDCRDEKRDCKKDCRDRRVLAATEKVDDLKLGDRRLGSTKKCLKQCRRDFKKCKKD